MQKTQKGGKLFKNLTGAELKAAALFAINAQLKLIKNDKEHYAALAETIAEQLDGMEKLEHQAALQHLHGLHQATMQTLATTAQTAEVHQQLKKHLEAIAEVDAEQEQLMAENEQLEKERQARLEMSDLVDARMQVLGKDLDNNSLINVLAQDPDLEEDFK